MNTTTANTITAREAQLIDRKLSIPVREAALGTSVRNVQVDALALNTTIEENVTGVFSSVSGMVYQGNRTVTQINALSPSRGQLYVATDSGTPSAGTSDALTAGDGAEYDGANWKKLWDGVGGFPPAGTVVVVGNGTLVAPLTDAADEKKIATWDGLSIDPVLTTPAQGDVYKVTNTVSVYYGEVFELATTWNSISTTSNAAAVDRVTNLDTLTAFATTKTVPLPSVAAGDELEWEAVFNVVQANSTDTLDLIVNVGAVALLDTGATDVVTADFLRMSGRVQFKAVGASGAITGASQAVGVWAGSPFAVAAIVGPGTALNTTANLTLNASATWSVASTSNKVDLIALRYRIVKSGT